MIIMKFGGSSVKNAAAFLNVTEIIRSHLDMKPVVVLSAMGGITDKLIDALKAATTRDHNTIQKILAEISVRHYETAADLVKDKHRLISVKKVIAGELHKLDVLLSATEAIGVQSGELYHAVVSIGELLSTQILNACLLEQGIDSCCGDSRRVVVIENRRGYAVPVQSRIAEQTNTYLKPFLADHQVCIMQGFIGMTPDGAPATLGRDGSDYTASILGAALQVQEIQIWSDVDGILSADPSIVPYAKPLKSMTFDEACELAYFGARVLHPATIQPAIENNISVRVRNSRYAQEPGTLIIPATDLDKEPRVKSIAYKEGITLLTIESSQLLLSPQLIEEIFDILSRQGKQVYAVSKSATKLSVTIQNSADPETLIREISPFGHVHVERNKVIVSVVGEKMKRNPELTWQLLRALDSEGIKPHLISQFANQISLMFIIDEAEIEKTVGYLHRKFIENDHPKE